MLCCVKLQVVLVVILLKCKFGFLVDEVCENLESVNLSSDFTPSINCLWDLIDILRNVKDVWKVGS